MPGEIEASAKREPETTSPLAGLDAVGRIAVLSEAFQPDTEAIAYPHAADRSLYEDAVAEARSRLDAAEWTAAWAEGRSMPLEQAVAHARENVSEDGSSAA